MEITFLGKLIEYERITKKISVNKLAEGVCSPSTLHRLEYGVRMPSFFVIERILERLGKSVNKIEFLYNEEDYKIYYLREIIENKVEQKKYEEAEEIIAYYSSLSYIKEPIHKQYVYKMKGVLCSERKQYEQAEKWFFEAIQLTIPDFGIKFAKNNDAMEKDNFLFRDFFKQNVIGEGELVLFLLWIQEKNRLDEGNNYIDNGKEILKYIDRICDDEEVKANVYSKATWIWGSLAEKQHQYKEAYQYMLEGEKCLTDNGLLLHLPQFLDSILWLTQKVAPKEYGKWKQQRDALKSLYEEHGKNWDTQELHIWKNYRQQELYLVSELFGQERRLAQKSQEKLADEIDVDLKTINRIERGILTPKQGTFRKLKEYFMIDRDICTMRIVVEDFSLLELEREIAKLNHHRREAEAEKQYLHLRKELSPEWPENRQYMIYMDMLFQHRFKRMDTRQALSECKRAFAVTKGNLELEQADKVVLSRMECFILNYICHCYDSLGRKTESITLLKKMLKGYENSKVSLKYHYASLSLIYEHLAIDCEEADELKEAVSWCDKAIEFNFLCGRGSNLGFILEQKIYTKDRMKEDVSDRKIKYLQAYYLLKLMKQNKLRKDLQVNYEKCYGETLLD